MRISGFELFQVPPRWLFLRIDTDEGISGWGEPVLEGRAEVVAAAVTKLMEHLLGADPVPIEDHWQVLTKGGFYRDGPILGSAVAGIDQALWDIAGKLRGAPVHELLGGPVRRSARVYGWIGGDEPKQLEEAAAERMESGLTAVKFNLSGRLEPLDRPSTIAACVDRVAAVRDVIGPDRDLVVDFHGRVSTAMARRILPHLEPLFPLFVEEPVLPEYSNRLPEIVAATSVPIATGERLYSRWDFRDVVRSGVAVVQPDPSHAHGVSEVRRIAALAETYDVQLAPHCPLGPIALAAALQIAFATPNFLIQEQSLGIHYNVDGDLLDYLADTSVFEIEGGAIPRLTRPGLGIEIDEGAVRRAAAVRQETRSQVWRHVDGSFAEW